jgi:hypothetical protein
MFSKYRENCETSNCWECCPAEFEKMLLVLTTELSGNVFFTQIKFLHIEEKSEE